jgi:hypothetical protein
LENLILINFEQYTASFSRATCASSIPAPGCAGTEISLLLLLSTLQHLLNKLEQRHNEDLKIDYLLEEKDVYFLRSCVMRDLDLYMKESKCPSCLINVSLLMNIYRMIHESFL